MGNGGYDVSHYGVSLAYEPKSGQLSGTAVITARAGKALSAFNFDFKGMDVRSVTVDGKAAEVSRAGQEMTVRPRDYIRKGAEFRTSVRYAGKPVTITDPDGSEEGWLRTGDGALGLGEPTGSMAWYPGNHHPSDKAAYDITVTVPEGLKAVSNGELRSERTSGGRTTFSWHAGEPVASYVATVAIGAYETKTYEIKSADGRKLPVYVAVDPAEANASEKVLDRIPEVVAWEEKNFGAYPFSSTGAVVDREGDAGYALETQNRPVFPGAPDLGTLVHEMAHQWYGDSVTPKSWRDMWLNEGFATYAEWMWEEDHGGDSAQQTFDALYRGDYYEDAANGRAVWAFPPATPSSAAHISGSPVYERGAMVLHKVRQTLGDDTFRTILKGWAATHRHGNADTADFTAYVEKVAGGGTGPKSQKAQKIGELREIWASWLYGDGRPSRP
ncbi:M1 family metallopeptidase [Streptomyces sp. NPDC091292]|uniref:M1 family metallopeptidase n=1 Tax=Streptomyces sp. NPDC091292 TaxID=3365991 RepID=UPI0038279BA4